VARRPPKDLVTRVRTEALTVREFERVEIGPPHGFGFLVWRELDAVVVLEQRRGEKPLPVGLLSRAYAERRAVAIPRENPSRSRRARRGR